MSVRSRFCYGDPSSKSMREVSCKSMREVSYSCGQCGYSLNLNASDRLVSSIGKKYLTKSRKSRLSFTNIDESRFKPLDELKCGPYFGTRHIWGFYRLRTKLLCGNCGALVGYVKENAAGKILTDYNSGAPTSVVKTFQVRIRSLQPEEILNCLNNKE